MAIDILAMLPLDYILLPLHLDYPYIAFIRLLRLLKVYRVAEII